MNCRMCERFLLDYIDGTLNRAAHQQIEAHVRACTFCAENVARTQAMLASLRRLEELRPSSTFGSELRRKVEMLGKQKRWKGLLIPHLKPIVVAGIVLLVSIGSTTFILSRRGDREEWLTATEVIGERTSAEGTNFVLSWLPSDFGTTKQPRSVSREQEEVHFILENVMYERSSSARQGVRYVLPAVQQRPVTELTSF